MSMTWRAIVACSYLLLGDLEQLRGLVIFLALNQQHTELRRAWCAAQLHSRGEVITRHNLTLGHAQPVRRVIDDTHSKRDRRMRYRQALRVKAHADARIRSLDSTSVECLFSMTPLPVSVRFAEGVMRRSARRLDLLCPLAVVTERVVERGLQLRRARLAGRHLTPGLTNSFLFQLDCKPAL